MPPLWKPIGEISRADEAARFFDGAEPDWSLALCPTLPRRAVVGRLADRIAGYGGLERPQVTLLTGPGGEGKSMALRQAVVALLEREPGLRVLWRRDDSCGITAERLLTLPKGDAPWLVATDAADLIAKPLHQGAADSEGCRSRRPALPARRPRQRLACRRRFAPGLAALCRLPRGAVERFDA